MVLELTSEQVAFKQSIEQFARDVVAPRAAAIDESGEFPLDVVRAAAGQGLLGATIPKRGAAPGCDFMRYVLAIEAIAAASATVAASLVVHNSLVTDVIAHAGRAPHKEQWLQEAGVAERSIGAFALSEPEAGTDAANQKTKAARTSKGYRITGRKVWVANADVAAVAIVFACTRPGLRGQGVTAFLVPLDTPGITRTARADSLGVRGLGCMDLDLDIEVSDESGARVDRSGISTGDVGASGRPRRHRRAGARHRRGGHRRGDRVREGAREHSGSRLPTTRRFSGCSPTWRPSWRPRGC